MTSLRAKFVGWAKAHLRRAHQFNANKMVGTLALCPPYGCKRTFAISRRTAPEVCQEFPALSISRAQGISGARCAPRSRVHK